jgi:hypothetical protein
MSSGNIGLDQPLTGHTKISQTEAIENEILLAAKRVTEIPSNGQLRCDYDGQTDGQPAYIGFAPRGLGASTTGWLIQKFTYDGSRQMTLRQIAYDSWDNRASATYA